jgi:hypothetical protein
MTCVLPQHSFDGLAQNAAMILDLSPEEFFSSHCVSPFYQPLRTIKSMLPNMATLPPEFRPTMAQLSYPHQAWIDCVPAPELRSRIIFGSSSKPSLFDPLDLWCDLLVVGHPFTAMHGSNRNLELSTYFFERWQVLFEISLPELQSMCLATNPPLALKELCEE